MTVTDLSSGVRIGATLGIRSLLLIILVFYWSVFGVLQGNLKLMQNLILYTVKTRKS